MGGGLGKNADREDGEDAENTNRPEPIIGRAQSIQPLQISQEVKAISGDCRSFDNDYR
jgi:hypothetical protein